MKRFIGFVVLAVVVGCGAPPPREGTVADADETAQTTAEIVSPQAKCKANAAARVPAWTAAGVSAAEIERRKNLAMSSCAESTVDSATAVYLGAVNTDFERLALRITAQTLTPEQYIHRMRDRARKARLGRSDKTWTADWQLGDTDHDLVPDKRDQCPNTPDLAPTADDGCPPDKLPAVSPMPDAERLHQILAKLGVLRSRECDGAAIPEVPTRVGQSLTTSGNGTLTLIIPRVRNQPAGCLVFYELEATERATTGAIASQRILLRDTDVWSDPTNRLFQFPNPSTGPKEQLRAKAAAGWEARIRVRAINANGQASAWSPLQ